MADGSQLSIELISFQSNSGAHRRLQTAIQRYQAKRNMDNDRLHIFKSWMQYGGVDTKTKMFGGLDQKDLKDLDSEDILQARATSSIPEDRQFWKVDFEEVAKGFLYVLIPSTPLFHMFNFPPC